LQKSQKKLEKVEEKKKTSIWMSKKSAPHRQEKDGEQFHIQNLFQCVKATRRPGTPNQEKDKLRKKRKHPKTQRK